MKDLKNRIIKLKQETPLIGGKFILIEDTCEEVFDNSDWRHDFYNFAVVQFLRTHVCKSELQCYYGKVDGLGYIVREDEFELSMEVEPEDK